MLSRINAPKRTGAEKVNIRDASFPAPFHAGLEYSSPARGTWNIVHTGMLIPEAHEIFVCACGCLRGVVLTAAEMNALDRYSSISISEEQVLDGGMEQLMIDGVKDIIEKLSYRPRAILLYISCQHFFLAYDQQYVFDTLSDMFPNIRFIDCYMIPTLRKSGLTPDQKMRIQLYKAWEKPEEKNEKQVNLIGSNLPLYEHAELSGWFSENGITLRQVHDCKDFDDYLSMASSAFNIYYEPLVHMAAEDLKTRLDMESCYLSFSFKKEELLEDYRKLASMLRLPEPDFTTEIEEMEKAIAAAKEEIGDTEIVIDYSFTFRPLSFARMLLAHGFRVTEIYADAFAADDKEDFKYLQEQYPKLVIRPTNRPGMRFVHETAENNVLAIGQKAAYFRGTDHFVNVAESGGYFGFNGTSEIMRLMREAYHEKKDRKEIIQKKGFGCESCI
ncbi:MAG: nitrogenase component 1 [Lachnospiraceae bacterium]|nr:nitrogenase component 1 [Lachnospiraceae bacterium]